MQVARKAPYSPYENESGRFWLRIGGRTFNFITTNEKEKEENGADPNAERLKGPFRSCVWLGFGTKKFKQDKMNSEEVLKENILLDEKGLDMK
ncbi:7be64807-1d1e-4f3a-9421-53e2a6f1a066 [Sclerotinia trifoliorum]|uniref:7be64807-1d1e-4f3a-9421-53e2a6f1a066 n=1 Tax=Sclerotinia trifoliorum TaxID=28548 RepID=A0A8H2ZUB1_9HELO|nr:7be64807-1d1e-4f3a-9421-53e2a6f1a066 [Sclerotinia trifoliorum]